MYITLMPFRAGKDTRSSSSHCERHLHFSNNSTCKKNKKKWKGSRCNGVIIMRTGEHAQATFTTLLSEPFCLFNERMNVSICSASSIIWPVTSVRLNLLTIFPCILITQLTKIEIIFENILPCMYPYENTCWGKNSLPKTLKIYTYIFKMDEPYILCTSSGVAMNPSWR